jgi:H+/Cl- antiporter ClcA
VVGAALVLGITWMLGTRDYLGIGVTTATGEGVSIVNAFTGGATPWSWFWKLLLTAITLSSGFKGGEVTPLFFVGATLGAALAGVLGVPVDLLAGIGFIAVFAGATNTPLACTIMGVELFGSQYLIYFATACFFAYLFSGHSGIYLSQRIGFAKGNHLQCEPGDEACLRSIREDRLSLFSHLFKPRKRS